VKPAAQEPASHPPCEVRELFRTELKIASSSDYGRDQDFMEVPFYNLEDTPNRPRDT
jgi:hypothetical protein